MAGRSRLGMETGTTIDRVVMEDRSKELTLELGIEEGPARRAAGE